ncbi:MAG: DUF2510 domain-containing protein [Acidimicrobiales bacterium]
MPTTRPRVPGWHPDPDDPSSLRHWNGKRWGNERRPRPSWAAQPRSAGLVSATGPKGDGPDTPTPASRRRWYLLAGGAILLAFLVISVPAWLGSGIEIPAQTVSDAGYTSRADAVCAAALPDIREDRPESREDNGTPKQFAARIDKAADGLAAVATDLRGIPASTAADGAEIDGWLDNWDAYIALGHQYAASIAAEDLEQGRDLSARSNRLAKRIYGFSKGNDMPSCVF